MDESLRARAASFGLLESEFDLVVERLQRQPNALEAALFGAMWSEHCGYKNSRPLLRRLPTEGEQVLQGPGENAGVVDIGDGLGVAFKLESHNHPSALEPFWGAATGVGGILRDIFAMGAEPFAVLSSLRFGEFDDAHNRSLLAGVAEGVAFYTDGVGVPLVGGEVETAPCYDDNPLVNVMALGLVEHGDLLRGTVGGVGNALYYIGAPTGLDGLGGAVFSSSDLGDSGADDSVGPSGNSASNVPHTDPRLAKRILLACLAAYEAGFVAGVQDMGAAGLTSSVSEMAYRAGEGVELHLSAVPRVAASMTPAELLLSESQERMVVAAPPGKEPELRELLRRWELTPVEIGTVVPGGRFRVYAGDELVADVPVAALNEAPTYVRDGVEAPAVVAARQRDLNDLPPLTDAGEALLTLLASGSIASKAALVAKRNRSASLVPVGEGDAAVLPVPGSRRAVAATVDCNARYVYLSPRLGAQHAVAEAARNLSVVGATPLAVTDNLNFGNPTSPHVYYQLSESIEGLREACLALRTPVTGGNVSLYNQMNVGGEQRAIHPTPVVGMVGVLPDAERHAGSRLTRAGDVLLLIGPASGSLGASEYLYRLHGLEAGEPPALDLLLEEKVQAVVRGLIQDGRCQVAHDTSHGGLAVTLAEMTMPAGNESAIGMRVELQEDTTAASSLAEVLFGEAASRVVVALTAEQVEEALARCEATGVPVTRIGVSGGDSLLVKVGASTIDLPLESVAAAYEGTYRAALGLS